MDIRDHNYPYRPRAWSPIRRAMVERDFLALMQEVAARSTSQPDGCLIWNGAISEPGYPRVFRAPIVYVHRLVAWGAAGFPGELSDVPSIHHRCARKTCVQPAHLASVGARLNSIEATTRQELTRRIAALEAAIQLLDPTHPVLATSTFFRDASEGEVPVATGFDTTALAARVRRVSRSATRAAEREALEAQRFAQVLEARRLRARGASRAESARLVRLDLSNLAYWEQKLEELPR